MPTAPSGVNVRAGLYFGTVSLCLQHAGGRVREAWGACCMAAAGGFSHSMPGGVVMLTAVQLPLTKPKLQQVCWPVKAA